MDKKEKMRGLDIDSLKDRMAGTISTEEALKDIVPFQYSKDVLEGKQKVIFSAMK